MRFHLELPAPIMAILVAAQLVLLGFLCAGHISALIGLIPIIIMGTIWFATSLFWCIKQML